MQISTQCKFSLFAHKAKKCKYKILTTEHKPGSHISGKSSTIGDLVVSRSSPIFVTDTGIDRENRNCFYFPDLSPFNPDDWDTNVFAFSEVGNIWDENCRSSGIFLTYENQALLLQFTNLQLQYNHFTCKSLLVLVCYEIVKRHKSAFKIM